MPDTSAPVRTKPATTPTPVRRYQPDWVCPSQKEETVRRLRDV